MREIGLTYGCAQAGELRRHAAYLQVHTNSRIIGFDEAHGTARRDLAAFPELVRRYAGYALFMVQVGREPSDVKSLPAVGSGAYEIRIRDAAGAFRVVYVAKFEKAVYVLHAFQKKTRKTPRADIERAVQRYRLIGERP